MISSGWEDDITRRRNHPGEDLPLVIVQKSSGKQLTN